MEKWKREAIVTGLSVLLVFAFIELVWSFFAGQSWGSSILRDFVYLLLTGIITVITVLSSDNELTKTPPNKSKFSNKEDIVNDTVSSTSSISSDTSRSSSGGNFKKSDEGYLENPKLREAAEAAQNHYRRMVRKFDDFDLAEEKLSEEAERYLKSKNVEIESSWYEDMCKYSHTDFEQFVLITLEQREKWTKFKDEGVLGSLDTYIDSCVGYAKEIPEFKGFSERFEKKFYNREWEWTFDN